LRADIGLLSRIDRFDDNQSVILPENSSLYTDNEDLQSLHSLKYQALASPNFVKRFEEDTSRYYEGEVRDGLKEGYGTLILENGDKYEGQWKQDMKDGFGVLTFSTGDIYTGHFSQGKEHG